MAPNENSSKMTYQAPCGIGLDDRTLETFRHKARWSLECLKHFILFDMRDLRKCQ